MVPVRSAISGRLPDALHPAPDFSAALLPWKPFPNPALRTVCAAQYALYTPYAASRSPLSER